MTDAPSLAPTLPATTLSPANITAKGTAITAEAANVINSFAFTGELAGVTVSANASKVETTVSPNGNIALKFTVSVEVELTAAQKTALETQVCEQMQAAINSDTVTTFDVTKYVCSLEEKTTTTRRRLLATTEYEVSIAYYEEPVTGSPTMEPTMAPTAVENDSGASQYAIISTLLMSLVTFAALM